MCKKYEVGGGKAAAQLILTQLSKSELLPLLLLPTLLLLPLPLLLKPLLLPTLLLLKPLRLLLLLLLTASIGTVTAAASIRTATLGLGPGVSGLGPGVSGLAPQTTSGCPAPAARFARRTHFRGRTLKKCFFYRQHPIFVLDKSDLFRTCR